MTKDFTYDVFLSHNSKDKPRVRRIAERLRDAGLHVWFDEWNIKPGEIISLKVDEGIDKSRVLVLCISANALTSGWVALERSTAIHRDPSNQGRRFIPLLLSECKLPDTLRRYKYIDFRNERQAPFADLIAACQLQDSQTAIQRPRKQQRKKARNTARKTDSLAVLQKKLSGQKGWMTMVACTPDGKSIVSAAEDGTINIWDVKTWTLTKTLKGPNGSTRSVTLLPDSKRLVTGSMDQEIRVWDMHTGRQIREWPTSAYVTGLAAHPDSRRVISCGGYQDTSLVIWDVNTGHYLRRFELPSGQSTVSSGVAIGADGKTAVSAYLKQVLWWDLDSGNQLAAMQGHSENIVTLQITSDSRFAISGSVDCTVRIWDLHKQSCVGTLEGHGSEVRSVAISPDDKLVASAGFVDSTVRIWHLHSGELVDVITETGHFTPTAIAFSPDGLALLVGTTASDVYVYRLKQKPAIISDVSRRYVNAKVVLLGEGTVGKTSLAHRLIEDKYVVRDRTHGMNVWPLPLPLPPNTSIECEALLWDLAGQEDYRLIHQLFLDETALALLLVNPQKNDPFAEAGDWLKALKAVSGQTEATREIPRLLIFSQIDVGGMKLGDMKIDRFRAKYNFTDWLATSAKTGENCSDTLNCAKPSKLKQLIAKTIPWDHLPWTSTPRLLAELKNALIVMRDKSDIRLVRLAELVQRLEQTLPGEEVGEADVRTAVTLLANQGLARQLKFGDLILLQPELLNGYAGAIIRAARKHTDEIGAVLEADIYKPTFDFTGVERLRNRSDEELLLRALVQTLLDHSLCIAEDTPQGRHLVFPSQYRREKDIPHDPDIFVSYTFSGEWQTVWTTLVVRLWYSQEFEHKELWRNAAEFASPKGFTLGLKIDNKQGEGSATVNLYFDKEVPDELKAIFIEYVHRHLAKYGCEVTRDRRYMCSQCGNLVKDLDAVRKRLESKKDFIYCQICDEKVQLVDFIEKRLKSDPVAQRILAMDATATHELDTQALEQILIGHMMAICGEANQIFRPVSMFDYGIDAEVEFKDDNGKASGKKIYIQLKSGNSYLRNRKRDGTEIFDVTNERHLDYWTNQPVDVYLVIRQTDEISGAQTIRWMNVSHYLSERKDNKSRQIVFTGEKVDMEAVWKLRDEFFPPKVQRQK